MSASVLVGYFEDEERLLAATRWVRSAGFKLHDVYTPYAVHGLDEAMGLRRSRLTWVCFIGGLVGLLSAIALQYYTSVVSWPLNVGGKPPNSAPAFVPLSFELTVLVAGLTTVLALFIRSRLGPGARSLSLPRTSDDRFALAIDTRGTFVDPEEALAALRRLGAVETGYAEVPR